MSFPERRISKDAWRPAGPDARRLFREWAQTSDAVSVSSVAVSGVVATGSGSAWPVEMDEASTMGASDPLSAWMLTESPTFRTTTLRSAVAEMA